MKKNLTELVMILDRSGSMSGLESDTIGGYNSMLKKQRETEGEVLVSTVLFDDRSGVLYDRVPLEKMPQMTRKEYYVRGCTALLDAVGGAIHHIGNVHKYARPEDVPAHTIFVIMTDAKQELLLEDANTAGIQRHLHEIEAFLETQQTDIEEYDEDLVRRLLERVTAYDDHLTFEFKSGIEIDITM